LIPLIALICNTFSLLILGGFAAVEIEKQYTWQLEQHRDSIKQDLERDFAHILGHKVWSGENTFRLLKDLIDKWQSRQTKWLMVNFLSQIVDDAVELVTGEGDFKVVTLKKWSVNRYSSFLAKNTVHAESSVWWQVTPTDFFRSLLPEFVAYTLACVALKHYGIPTTANHVPPDQVFTDEPTNGRKYSQSHLKTICASLGIDEHAETECASTDVGLQEIEYFRKYFLNIAKEYGLKALEEGAVIDETGIFKLFEETLMPKYVTRLFPHIKAFKDAAPKSSKLRVIFFKGKCDVRSPKCASERIEKEWPHGDDELKVQDLKWPNWTKQSTEKIVEVALNLFAYTCSGEHVVAFASSSDGVYQEKDLGIYDSSFAISATSSGDERTVTLAYWPDGAPKESALFEQIDTLIRTMKNGESGGDIGYIHVVWYRHFVKMIVEHMKSAPTVD
jgi:hypothetical protein